jgi:ubiquinone/menaquinone biosynthesis C-methylase UbiE
VRFNSIDVQRAYYADTAHKYDDLHVAEYDEYSFALQFMTSVLEPLGVRSTLDVGSGTGARTVEN